MGHYQTQKDGLKIDSETSSGSTDHDRVRCHRGISNYFQILNVENYAFEYYSDNELVAFLLGIEKKGIL